MTEADISKRIQAKLNVKKKEWAFMSTPVTAPADPTGADIFKEDTSKAKRDKKKYWPAWVHP